jgi:hypothetical protein
MSTSNTNALVEPHFYAKNANAGGPARKRQLRLRDGYGRHFEGYPFCWSEKERERMD